MKPLEWESVPPNLKPRFSTEKVGMLHLSWDESGNLEILYKKRWQNGLRDGVTNQDLVCSNESIVVICHGEKRAEMKGKALDLQVHLGSNPHLSSGGVDLK